MKNILFVIPEYSFGGTNKSLQNLINLLDTTKYKVYVYCLYEDGGNYYKNVFKKFIVKKGLFYYFLHDNVVTRKILGAYQRLNKNYQSHWLYKHEARRLEKKYNFDIVISYQELLSTEFVSYFKVPKKIAWVQCDYPVLVGKSRYDEDLSYYQKYHTVVCVSNYATQSMKSFYPQLSVTFAAIYNTLDVDFIRNKSKEGKSGFDKSVFNMVSVGRVTEVKGFKLIPAMVSKLKERVTKPFKWYIIGDGEDMGEMQTLIKSMKVEDYIVLLGYQDNPYPYIYDADLYVCTSESESFSYTIAESKVLHTPVLSNDFPVAYEVVSEKEGWVENNSKMVSILQKLIMNENLIYSKVKSLIQNYTYNNNAILNKIDKLFLE